MLTDVKPPVCPNCGSDLTKKEKDGKAYWACPNWKPNNAGCKGYFWSPDDGKKKSWGGSSSKELLGEQIKTNELLGQILEMVSCIVKDTTEL